MTNVSAARVDAFFREGRIGRALLRMLNRDNDTTFSMRVCEFTAFKGDDGLAWVGIRAGDTKAEIQVGSLYLILGQDISDVERAFLVKLDIGYKLTT